MTLEPPSKHGRRWSCGVENMDAVPNVTSDGQLSYVGRDCQYVPRELSAVHGTATRRLDLSFNCLRDLSGIEAFPNLEELVLDNNIISDSAVFPSLPRLHTLTLNKNNLQDLDSLIEKLRVKMPSLTYLSLLSNKACPNQLSAEDKDEEDYQRYRYYILYQLPQLRFLDSTPVRLNERKEAQRQGPYLKVVRPALDTSRASEVESPSRYTPLPKKLRDNDGTATFGKCKYVYYGRHSEGNRFIRNNDL